MNHVTAFVRAALFAIAIAASALPPVLAPSSAQAAPPAAAEKFGLMESRAAVMALPEAKAWEDKRKEQAAKDRTGTPPGGVLTSRRMIKGVKHWAVSFIEDPQGAARKWAVFIVRAADGRIFVESEGGKLITLEDWRKTRPAV